MSEPEVSSRWSALRGDGTLRIARVAGVDVLVRASWLVVAVLISVTLAPRVSVVAPELGRLAYVAGLVFAVLLYASVLLHEMAHVLMAQTFGMRVRSVTLHFLGGVTEIDGEAATPKREFWISVVGPLMSGAVGLAAWGAAAVTPPGLVDLALGGLAASNLAVAVLNLVPALPLDGGKVLRAAVWAVSGRPHLATRVAGWCGRVAAVLVLTYPLLVSAATGVQLGVLDFVIPAIIASFLWAGASSALLNARVRERLPQLSARALARRAVLVPVDMPLAEALRRAGQSAASSVVVVRGDGLPAGVVSEQAVSATPPERRPWVSAGAVARRLEPGLRLPADIEGEELLRAMHATPAPEYVLAEDDGSVYGVLTSDDVDAAFRRT